jgi:hypothetical protein
LPDISITQTPPGPVGPDTQVTLAVAVSPDPSQYTYTWQQADGSIAAGKTIVVMASSQTRGRYRVTARPKRAGGESLNAEHALQVEGQSPPATPPPPPNSGPLVYDPWFAGVAAIAILIFAVLLLAPLAYRLYDTDAADAVDRMATLTSLGLLSIGAVALLLGVYGGLLEVRGRLRTRKDREDLREVPPAITAEGAEGALKGLALVIDAIGKLRGVALILVIGCVPLVAAAWVAQSGVGNEPGAAATPTARAATRTPSPPPSATATPTP